VLVVGGGGREHALVWKIARSPLVDEIYAAPGNGGIARIARCVDIASEDLDSLLSFAKKERIDLTIVGPEMPLALGIVDEFTQEGLRIFGPTKRAAQIESNKSFAKELMRKHSIPTAQFRSFTDRDEAVSYIDSRGAPVVVKASGLTAGKGVIVTEDRESAVRAVDRIMLKKEFGEAGEVVVVEELLVGEEASVLAFTDGKTVLPMLPSQDHKPIYDGDRGPNTGGMGAYAPAPIVDTGMLEAITRDILMPIVRGMEQEGVPYKGVLYAGLMITQEGPKVLEFNCRFGDPEIQSIFPLLKNDLLEVITALMDGRLVQVELKWEERDAVCVVLASGGYPGDYEKGKPITGVEEAEEMEDVILFHAGTKLTTEGLVTSGGRVMGVTGLGHTLKEAIGTAYSAVGKIHFEGAYFRRDIGEKGLRRVPA